MRFNAFSFLKDNTATTLPREYVHYRPPKLKKLKKGWHVEYWFRIPDKLKPLFNNKNWHRFKVYEDINRHKDDEYANILLKAVKHRLSEGFDPFRDKMQPFIDSGKELTIAVSLNTGLKRFIDYCKEKGLRKNSIRSYQTLVNFLQEYFLKDNKVYQPVEAFTKDDIRGFFSHYKKPGIGHKGWSNYTYNNYLTFTKAIFNWFVKEDIIMKSPCIGIEELKTNISKHKYYPDDLAEKIKRDVQKSDPELYEFMQMIYYCAIRPQELRALQVKHILFDRKLLFVPAYISKNKTDDYIPLGEDVLQMLKSRKDLPANRFLFGGEKKRSVNHFGQHYKPFKEKYNLDDDYTLYSWKHSRAIHLAQAGADPYQIMRLFRHSSLEITMKYLRDLGIQDFSELHAKTKKF